MTHETADENGLVDTLPPWPAVDQLVRLFRARRDDEAELVGAVCHQAVALIDGVDDAGVILAAGRRHLKIVAATGAVPRQLDELQDLAGDGPCLAAARTRELIVLDDLAADPRWAEFSVSAIGAGVGAMVCLPLHVDDRVVGTLSLYAAKPYSIGPKAVAIGSMLAVLAAITLAETRVRAALETALRNGDVIGQAKGILMYSRRVTADEAFALLVERSQHSNTKLVRVAEAVVETGTL